MAATTDVMWIEVGMWSGLSGRVQPFTDVECDPPERSPDGSAGWRDWALEHLSTVAEQDAWQPGRYHFTVQERDPSGRPLTNHAEGFWDWPE